MLSTITGDFVISLAITSKAHLKIGYFRHVVETQFSLPSRIKTSHMMSPSAIYIYLLSWKAQIHNIYIYDRNPIVVLCKFYLYHILKNKSYW